MRLSHSVSGSVSPALWASVSLTLSAPLRRGGEWYVSWISLSFLFVSFLASISVSTPALVSHPHESPIFEIWLGKEWAASLANDQGPPGGGEARLSVFSFLGPLHTKLMGIPGQVTLSWSRARTLARLESCSSPTAPPAPVTTPPPPSHANSHLLDPALTCHTSSGTLTPSALPWPHSCAPLPTQSRISST